MFFPTDFYMICKLHEQVMLTIQTSKLRTLLALSICTCLYRYEDCNGPGPSARLAGLYSTSPFSHAVLSTTFLSKISELS